MSVSEEIRFDWDNVTKALYKNKVDLPRKACWIDSMYDFDEANVVFKDKFKALKGVVDTGRIQAPPGKCGWLYDCPRNPTGKNFKKFDKVLTGKAAFSVETRDATSGDLTENTILKFGQEPTYVPCKLSVTSICLKLIIPGFIFFIFAWVFAFIARNNLFSP